MSETGIVDKILSLLISATVSFFVARFTIKKQKSEHSRREICRRIEELEGKGRLYWSRDGRQEELAEEIVTLFQFLNQDVETLNLTHKMDTAARTRMGAFYRAVTGKTFDSVRHTQDKSRRDWLRDAASEARAVFSSC